MFFILNKNAQISTGEHKIHKRECNKKPKHENTIELGEFYNSKAAQCEARKYYGNIDGCKYCCKEIHID